MANTNRKNMDKLRRTSPQSRNIRDNLKFELPKVCPKQFGSVPMVLVDISSRYLWMLGSRSTICKDINPDVPQLRFQKVPHYKSQNNPLW